MTVHWVAILLVATALVRAPGSVGAARRVFAGELAAKLAAAQTGDQGFHHSAFDTHDSDPEEFDLLNLLNREYDSPLGFYGYGGYGYGHYCDGYYGCRLRYAGYGDTPPEDSYAAYEDLLQRDADLRVRQHAHDRMFDRRRTSDVYGMEPSWAVREQHMMRRVMRAEAMHRLQLDSDLDGALVLLKRPDRLLGETEYGDLYDFGAGGGGDAQWDDDFPFPFPDAALGPHGGGCHGGYYGGNYGCQGCYGCYGGYGGHGGYGDPFEDLLADPHNLELQEALLEVRQKLRHGGKGSGGAKAPVGRDVSEMEEEVRRLMP